MKLDKQVYIAPEMTIVKLDNEISLVLQSDPFPNRPPGGPGEGYIPNAPTQDPFKTNLA